MSKRAHSVLAVLVFAAAISFVPARIVSSQTAPAVSLSAEEKAVIERVSEDSLKGNLSFIASDLLEGRATPSRGLDLAAEYIAAQFRRAGIEPAVDNGYFQTVTWKLSEPVLDDFDLKIINGPAAADTIVLKPSQVTYQSDNRLMIDNALVFKVDASKLDVEKPTEADVLVRTERKPMNKKERIDFIKTFFPGLFMLVIVYIMLTIIRDYRSNFAANIWKETGHGNDISLFTKTEIPSSLLVLVLMSLLVYIKSNIRAFLVNHFLIVIGFALSLCGTLLFVYSHLSGFWWMTITGIGLYMGYVPFNCMLFERMIASFRYVSNACFIIYVADSFGYLGSDVVLLLKNFSNSSISYSDFFVKMILAISALGTGLTILSSIYFKSKYQRYFTPSSNLSYA